VCTYTTHRQGVQHKHGEGARARDLDKKNSGVLNTKSFDQHVVNMLWVVRVWKNAYKDLPLHAERQGQEQGEDEARDKHVVHDVIITHPLACAT
jgi:hypothetical protein